MPKMPDLQTFESPVRVQGERAIGSYDLSPLARGNAAMQQGVETLGKGIQAVGTDIKDVSDANDRYQYAIAKASFNIDHTNLQQGLAHDQDYSTLQPRYMEQAQAAQSRWADTISNSGLRARFNADTGQTIASGNVAAKNQAFYQEGQAKIVDLNDRGKTLSDQTIADPMNEGKFGTNLQNYGDMVDGLVAQGHLTAIQGAAMKDSWAHSAGVGVGLARADIDPTGASNEVRAAPGSPDQITNRILQNEGVGKDRRSSAVGGFIDGTWLDLIRSQRPDLAQGKSDADILALRADAGLRRDMTDAYRNQNTAYLKGQGLDANPGNQYLAHFLGPAGAAAVLKADPKKPVADVLAEAFGPAKEKAMIDANPEVLGGKLAGSVVGWAQGKMGGAIPGGGHIYDWLDDNQRRQIAGYAANKLEALQLDRSSDLKQRVEDTASEAARTGYATNPVTQSEFVATQGPIAGPKAYAQYQAGLKVAADISNVARMSVEQQNELLKSYEPQPGEGYEAAAERRDAVAKAIVQVHKERDADPAAFAINRVPAVKAAYDNFSQVTTDPLSTPQARQLAARDYVNKTAERQLAAGVAPEDVTIAPAGYVGRLNAAVTNAATSDDPKARVNAIARIQQEAALWGDAWPQVARQLPRETSPVIRGIAAATDATAPQAAVQTANVAYARLLSLGPKENPAAILKEQSETKYGDVQKGLNAAMAPFLSTMVGAQKDSDFGDYYNMALKLAALYVRDGKDATSAAGDAFNALIGNRYDIKDTYRVPKSTTYSADDVQAGAQAARTRLAEFGAKPAVDDVGGLTNAAGNSLRLFGRDGVWVTSPRNDGLNLMYGDKAVRTTDGAPLFLSWAQLAQMGGTPESRAAAVRRAAEEAPAVLP